MKFSAIVSRCLAWALCMSMVALGSVEAAEVECISGGVGKTERDSLQQQPEPYSLWLITAAKKTGAYLSGARVMVRDTKDQSLLALCHMDGPWLYLALPVGRYELETIYSETPGAAEQRVKKVTSIHPGDHHQMLIYFDVPGAEVEAGKPGKK